MDHWVIYDHPEDWPQYYVARRWVVRRDAFRPTDEVMMHPDLDVLRSFLHDKGLAKIDRSPGDEGVIVEVWL